MKSLQRTTIALIAGIAAFLNIEAISTVWPGIIGIGWFVYPIGILSVISIIITPWLRTPLIVFWGGAYLAAKSTAFHLSEFSQTASMLSAGIEIFSLAALFWLAIRFTQASMVFMEIVEGLGLDGESGFIRPWDQSLPDIKSLLTLSRRHAQPLSFIFVESAPRFPPAIVERCLKEMEQTLSKRAAAMSMAHLVGKTLRRTDMLLRTRKDNRLVIVCPQTDAKTSGILVDRIKKLAHEAHGLLVKCSLASFPEEALTIEDLIDKAESGISDPANAEIYYLGESSSIRNKVLRKQAAAE
jgi:hypothetical protein